MGDQEKATLLMLKGAISDLTKDQQGKIAECKTKLMTILEEYGDEGKIALSIIGLELSDSDELKGYQNGTTTTRHTS